MYLYVCIYVCVSPDTSGCQCFALGGKSVCVRVCERETEAVRDPSAQAKRKAMPGKTGQYHASLCCIPKLQINVLVQFSSQANLSCLLCFNKSGLKTLTTWISPNAGTWFALFFREDAQIIKLHCTRGENIYFLHYYSEWKRNATFWIHICQAKGKKCTEKKHNKHREKKVYLQLKASYKDFFFSF